MRVGCHRPAVGIGQRDLILSGPAAPAMDPAWANSTRARKSSSTSLLNYSWNLFPMN